MHELECVEEETLHYPMRSILKGLIQISISKIKCEEQNIVMFLKPSEALYSDFSWGLMQVRQVTVLGEPNRKYTEPSAHMINYISNTQKVFLFEIQRISEYIQKEPLEK